MTRRLKRGFVRNEPLIVLVIFGLLCLIAGLAFGAAFRWAWGWRLAAGCGLFGVGIGAFALYVRITVAQAERAASERRERGQSSVEE